jgi:hypothetical protein
MKVLPYYWPEPNILGWLQSFILPEDIVLDVGSGDGRYRYIGAKEYYSLDCWEAAKPNYLIDLNKINLPTDREFSVIMCLDVLEHIEKDRSLEILNQAIGLAKRTVIVFVPLSWDENRFAYEDKKGFYYHNECVLHKSEWYLNEFNEKWQRVILPSTIKDFFGYLT